MPGMADRSAWRLWSISLAGYTSPKWLRPRSLLPAVTAVLRQPGPMPALDYVALVRQHIAKENQILLVMAERMLSPLVQTRLFTEFEGVDKNKMGEGNPSGCCKEPSDSPRSPHESCPARPKAR